jgi:hypothetical protein
VLRNLSHDLLIPPLSSELMSSFQSLGISIILSSIVSIQTWIEDKSNSLIQMRGTQAFHVGPDGWSRVYATFNGHSAEMVYLDKLMRDPATGYLKGKARIGLGSRSNPSHACLISFEDGKLIGDGARIEKIGDFVSPNNVFEFLYDSKMGDIRFSLYGNSHLNVIFRGFTAEDICVVVELFNAGSSVELLF